MYELYKTFKRSLSAILDGLQIEPHPHQLVCCFVSVLEHPPLSGGVLHQPGRSDGNGKNRLQSNLSPMPKEFERLEIHLLYALT